MGAINQRTIDGDLGSSGGPVHCPSRLIVNGSITRDASVFAAGDIIVRGRIDNAHVESSAGGVYVDQGIEGEACVVLAIGDIKARFIKGARVESQGSINVGDLIFKARVKARNFLKVQDGHGIIECSVVEAGLEIAARSLGSFQSEMSETRLSLENYRQRELFELDIVYGQRLTQKRERLDELKKVIEVIRIIGSRVATLSSEKRHELAVKVKEYNELNTQVTEILDERRKVLAERERAGSVFRSIVAREEVFSGVEVRIDNAKVVTNKKYKNVIFYKSGIVIIGDLDAFMERKRQFV